MVNIRNYGAGVITGLVFLAQGRCYWPDCEERLVRFVGGTPVNNFETAHIRAANPGGRRYVQQMTDSERNAFTNLVLLCLVHHKIVDKIRPDDFTIETMQEWKQQREAAGHAALSGLQGLTEDRLQEMIGDSFQAFKGQFDDALGQLARVNEEAADLLRPLVAELAEARFQARFPDQDTATMLADAADQLVNLPDAAAVLYDAASKLDGLEGRAAILSRAAEQIQNASQFM